jgi:predicted DNA-binding transcriptional regulator AlpA
MQKNNMLLILKDYIALEAFASKQGVGRRRVYQWIDEGLIPSPTHFLGRAYFPKAAIADFKAPWKKSKIKPGPRHD